VELRVPQLVREVVPAMEQAVAQQAMGPSTHLPPPPPARDPRLRIADRLSEVPVDLLEAEFLELRINLFQAEHICFACPLPALPPLAWTSESRASALARQALRWLSKPAFAPLAGSADTALPRKLPAPPPLPR
jgi:hypothetical protein